MHRLTDTNCQGKTLTNKKLISPALLGGLLLLTACGGSEPEPSQSLEERVMARWAYMIERDFESAWEYYSPGFRQMTPQQDFARDMGRRPVRWRSAELAWIECDRAERCEARVDVIFQALGAPAGQSQMRVPQRLTETWILSDGQWWFSAN